MIAVIADDLTGAAELAGIGLTYGLTVELAMSVNSQSRAELIVIATDARSVSESEAVQEMTDVSEALGAMQPDLIYKKVDSVLRGHIIAEVHAQLVVLGLTKALIVPANPALGRTLVDGHYYIHGERIHTTHFAEDPEFPITESAIQKRFSGATGLQVLAALSILPNEGIIIGEAEKQADLHNWVNHLDKQTLPIGGSGFFAAILDSLQLPKKPIDELVSLNECRLYVCGSSFGDRVELVKSAKEAGHAVSYMPSQLTNVGGLMSVALANWATEIAGYLQRKKQVILAIDPDSTEGKTGMALHLRTVMAMVVKEVLNQVTVHELIIEGGSTAASVLREIGITRLEPVQELATGVVRTRAIKTAEYRPAGCRPEELYITVKPGSYQWPPALWSLGSH
ncbi:hypothetical protein GCM10028808_66210 [Spirosoma migulaei]